MTFQTDLVFVFLGLYNNINIIIYYIYGGETNVLKRLMYPKINKNFEGLVEPHILIPHVQYVIYRLRSRILTISYLYLKWNNYVQSCVRAGLAGIIAG